MQASIYKINYFSFQATRKISKCGYLFVAPGWDFSNPLNRTKVSFSLSFKKDWYSLPDVLLNYTIEAAEKDFCLPERAAIDFINHFRFDAQGYIIGRSLLSIAGDRAARCRSGNLLIIEKVRISRSSRILNPPERPARYVFLRSRDAIRAHGSLRENVTSRNTYINEIVSALFYIYGGACTRARMLFLSKLSPTWNDR